MFFGKKDDMCAVRKAQLRWQDATFSVPHVSVRCSRPQPDGCKEEYCEGKQKREAEQSERRKKEPEKKKSESSQTTDSDLCFAGACSGGRDRWRGILGGAFDEGNRGADCGKHAGIDDYVKVESCKIVQGTGTFSVKASVEEKPASDDDNFYLLKMNMYDTELDAGAEPIASVQKDKEFSLTANVNENQVDSRLMSKFVVAVKLKDAYVPLCDPCYMTNPEALASYQAAYPQRSSIKGILVDPLRVDELDELHVNHAAYNIPVGNILGETTNGLFPTVYYTYDGRTYAFNGQRIAEYDSIFSRLTAKGITISAILLNNRSSAYPELTHPLSQGGSANYYAFNAAEADGVKTLAAVGAFLAQRYRDNDHGIS